MLKDGMTWYWCKWHKRWDTHRDQDSCRARKKYQQAEAEKNATNTDQSPTKVKSDKAKALIAMTTDADGHESISNSDDDSV
jgi:hypothetical protein